MRHPRLSINTGLNIDRLHRLPLIRHICLLSPGLDTNHHLKVVPPSPASMGILMLILFLAFELIALGPLGSRWRLPTSIPCNHRFYFPIMIWYPIIIYGYGTSPWSDEDTPFSMRPSIAGLKEDICSKNIRFPLGVYKYPFWRHIILNAIFSI